MRRLLTACSMLCLSLGLPAVATVASAAPAGAATVCTAGETVHLRASFAPNPVHRGAMVTNTLVLTNCTGVTQRITVKGRVSAPASCGGGSMPVGPIAVTLSPHQTITRKQPFTAPPCPGTYTQLVRVFKGTQLLTQRTAKFTVT
jgi:hypothetical protein